MRRLTDGSIDIVNVRRAHPIHEVVAASGVELQPRGHGFVGCCPFHEGATPSLSVDGVPDRFHCFVGLVIGDDEGTVTTCAEAKKAGYGPYFKGQDPEYEWYRDADQDDVVCE